MTYLREIVNQKVNILIKTRIEKKKMRCCFLIYHMSFRKSFLSLWSKQSSKILCTISLVKVVLGLVAGEAFLWKLPLRYLSLLGKHCIDMILISDERLSCMLGHV